MSEEKRIGETPVPEDFKEVLNEAQILTLTRMEEYGWELKFIRRPLFQDILPVLFHPDNNQTGVLEDDGTLNMQRDINVRD
jgi:hypothetical protein